MKRIALVLLMAASATALFATGVAEAPGRTGSDGEFAPPADAVFTSIELTGTVEMMDDHAVLTADGKTYLLAIPRIAWYADDVADGTVITVSGNLVDGVTHDEVDFDGDGHIMVQQVVIDGEVFAVGSMGGQGAMGGRFDVAQRGNFTTDGMYGQRYSDDESFGRGGFYDEDDMYGRGPMVEGDEWNGRGGYAADDSYRGSPQRGDSDFGRPQMPRGRQAMPQGRRI